MLRPGGVVGDITTKLVKADLVEQASRLTDRFTVLLTLTGIALGVCIAEGVALAAGVDHPLPVYIVVSVAGAATVIFGVLAAFEWAAAHKSKTALDLPGNYIQYSLNVLVPANTTSVSGSTPPIPLRQPKRSSHPNAGGAPLTDPPHR